MADEWTDIEAVRWGAAVGTPAPRPPHFDERYVLPEHREKLMQTKFAHARDSRICFYENEHIYEIDGWPADERVVAGQGLEEEFNLTTPSPVWEELALLGVHPRTERHDAMEERAWVLPAAVCCTTPRQRGAERILPDRNRRHQTEATASQRAPDAYNGTA